mgnify:CR=1 FL=1
MQELRLASVSVVPMNSCLPAFAGSVDDLYVFDIIPICSFWYVRFLEMCGRASGVFLDPIRQQP